MEFDGLQERLEDLDMSKKFIFHFGPLDSICGYFIGL